MCHSSEITIYEKKYTNLITKKKMNCATCSLPVVMVGGNKKKKTKSECKCKVKDSCKLRKDKDNKNKKSNKK